MIAGETKAALAREYGATDGPSQNRHGDESILDANFDRRQTGSRYLSVVSC